ncbi:MAG: glycosyltransferase [Pseudomonadota bacterium]
MSSRRVLHVITSLDRGGTEGFLAGLAPKLRARGIEQEIAVMVDGGDHATTLRDAGFVVHELGMSRGVPDPRGLLRLARCIKAFNPDVVQGWLYHANLVAALVKAFAAPPAKLIWNIRSVEMDPADYGWSLRLVVKLGAWLSRRPGAVVFNSEAGRRAHQKLGFAPDKLTVIQNGIDTQTFRPMPEKRTAMRATLGLSDETVVAAIVARNDPAKDLPGTIAALDHAGGVTGVFVGTDTEKLNAGQHVVLGMRRDVPEILSACDMVVLGSKSEGFPNAVAEGMAAGLPAVATDVGDVSLIVGECGRVVPAEDSMALSAAIASIAQLSPGERAALGARARDHIEQSFSMEVCVDRFAALYER